MTCLAVSCLDLSQRAVTEMHASRCSLSSLCEELQLFLPAWVDALAAGPPHQGHGVRGRPRGPWGTSTASGMCARLVEKMAQCELVTGADVTAMRLGSGSCRGPAGAPRQSVL